MYFFLHWQTITRVASGNGTTVWWPQFDRFCTTSRFGVRVGQSCGPHQNKCWSMALSLLKLKQQPWLYSEWKGTFLKASEVSSLHTEMHILTHTTSSIAVLLWKHPFFKVSPQWCAIQTSHLLQWYLPLFGKMSWSQVGNDNLRHPWADIDRVLLLRHQLATDKALHLCKCALSKKKGLSLCKHLALVISDVLISLWQIAGEERCSVSLAEFSFYNWAQLRRILFGAFFSSSSSLSPLSGPSPVNTDKLPCSHWNCPHGTIPWGQDGQRLSASGSSFQAARRSQDGLTSASLSSRTPPPSRVTPLAWHYFVTWCHMIVMVGGARPLRWRSILVSVFIKGGGLETPKQNTKAHSQCCFCCWSIVIIGDKNKIREQVICTANFLVNCAQIR